jgi:predicted N-acetyltransferase YhbS
MKQQLIDLWKASFGDSDEFIALWFDRVYSEDRTLVIKEERRIISAVHIVPYEVRYYDKRLPAAYVCGVCTLPEERQKGHMTRLMQQAHAFMRERGFAIAMLIPNSQTLCAYYRRFGYISMFSYNMELYALPKNTPGADSYRVVPTGMITKRHVYPYYDRKQNERPGTNIIHSEYDLETVRLDCQMDGGDCWMALQGKKVVGIAFTARKEGLLIVKESVCDSANIKNMLIQTVMRNEKLFFARETVPVYTKPSVPHGMALVLNPETLYPIYQKFHPATTIDLKCPDAALLTQTLLDNYSQSAYMNLMLD